MKSSDKASISLSEVQALIGKIYRSKDQERGAEGTFLWLMEEVGELAAAIREGKPQELQAEFADVVAWLASLANVLNIDLSQAVIAKYGNGCPGCGKSPCECQAEKP